MISEGCVRNFRLLGFLVSKGLGCGVLVRTVASRGLSLGFRV